MAGIIPKGTSWSMLLNGSYHEKYHYVRAFMKYSGWGIPGQTPGVILASVIESVLWQISLYMIKGWGSEQLPRYQAFYKVNGVGHVRDHHRGFQNIRVQDNDLAGICI